MNPANVSVDEAVAFLDRFPDVEAVDLILYDGNGVGRGKIIRRAELVHVFEQGVSLPASILGQEVCGEDVDATGLVWDRGDGDMRAWPVAGTLKLVHGSSPLRGEMLISLYDLDGSPMPSDPRHVLQRRFGGGRIRADYRDRRLDRYVWCQLPIAGNHFMAHRARPLVMRLTLCNKCGVWLRKLRRPLR